MSRLPLRGWFKSEVSSGDLSRVARANLDAVYRTENNLLQEPSSDSEITLHGFGSASAVNLLPELDREHLPSLGNDDFQQLAAKLEAEASVSEIAMASDSMFGTRPISFLMTNIMQTLNVLTYIRHPEMMIGVMLMSRLVSSVFLPPILPRIGPNDWLRLGKLTLLRLKRRFRLTP